MLRPPAGLGRGTTGCAGRFWEGRFYSQALLDEKALLACMVYNDLNPIHTSIQQAMGRAPSKEKPHPIELLPFVGDLRNGAPKGIPFHYSDYVQLVEWTGRAVVPGKRGAIPDDLPPILERLQFDAKQWLFMAQNFESHFKGLVGMTDVLRAMAHSLGYRRTPGLSACQTYLN